MEQVEPTITILFKNSPWRIARSSGKHNPTCAMHHSPRYTSGVMHPAALCWFGARYRSASVVGCHGASRANNYDPFQGQPLENRPVQRQAQSDLRNAPFAEANCPTLNGSPPARRSDKVSLGESRAKNFGQKDFGSTQPPIVLVICINLQRLHQNARRRAKLGPRLWRSPIRGFRFCILKFKFDIFRFKSEISNFSFEISDMRFSPPPPPSIGRAPCPKPPHPPPAQRAGPTPAGGVSHWGRALRSKGPEADTKPRPKRPRLNPNSGRPFATAAP